MYTKPRHQKEANFNILSIMSRCVDRILDLSFIASLNKIGNVVVTTGMCSIIESYKCTYVYVYNKTYIP